MEAIPDTKVVIGSGPTFAFEDVKIVHQFLQCDKGKTCVDINQRKK